MQLLQVTVVEPRWLAFVVWFLLGVRPALDDHGGIVDLLSRVEGVPGSVLGRHDVPVNVLAGRRIHVLDGVERELATLFHPLQQRRHRSFVLVD